MTKDTFTRRDFLIGATAATAGVWLASQELFAETTASAVPAGPPVGVGVIGLGLQGKDIVTILAKLPSATVVALCDTYEPYNKRALEIAPKATTYVDYQKLLEQKDVEAVIIATPSHKHKDIVLAAIAAGKHVYCEAPLAGNIEEAKVIAKAGLGSKQVFQAGLQLRSNPLHKHVLGFVKTGVPGKVAQGRAQWHKKQSWRRMAPTPEREAELNWKLYKATSTGLLGEIGLHQMDVMNWYLEAIPTAVTSFGGILNYNDGRDVADTVQCVFEYPGNVNFVYDVTLTNSFDTAYEAIYGSDAAILLHGQYGWMFKEADSAMLGWEVYARKEKIGEETGIALVADASKQLKAGKEPGKEEAANNGKDALYYAIEEFTTNARTGAKPSAGAEAGYRAAVTAIKANEALVTQTKVSYQKEWFDLG